MNTTRQCSKQLWRSGVRSRTFPCKRAGKVERDGQWYCTQHDPVRVAERNEARYARWERKWAEEKAKWRLEAATPDLLKALKLCREQLDVCGHGAGCDYCREARELANDAIAKAEGKR